MDILQVAGIATTVLFCCSIAWAVDSTGFIDKALDTGVRDGEHPAFTKALRFVGMTVVALSALVLLDIATNPYAYAHFREYWQ